MHPGQGGELNKPVSVAASVVLAVDTAKHSLVVPVVVHKNYVSTDQEKDSHDLILTAVAVML